MIFDPTFTVGNLLTILVIAGGLIGTVLTMLSKFGVVIYRLGAIERRVDTIERQNVLPIPERRRVR